MKMKLKGWCLRWLMALTLGMAVGVQSGCVVLAAGAGAGAVAYVRGELATTLASGYNAACKASDRALGQLEFARISERKDAMSARVTARTALDRKVEIVLTKVGDDLTQVKIRVGVFGDEAVSLAILDRIKANL